MACSLLCSKMHDSMFLKGEIKLTKVPVALVTLTTINKYIGETSLPIFEKKSYQTYKTPSFYSDASFLLTKQSSAKI